MTTQQIRNLVAASRIILSCLLIYLIYTETGVWTALSLALVMLGIELNTVQMAGVEKRLDIHLKRINLIREEAGKGHTVS